MFYVFFYISPDLLSSFPTFGLGFDGLVQHTDEHLIGSGTEPTVTALILPQFGVGSTQWGTAEVRVYPGETSGRIEVTFKYDK